MAFDCGESRLYFFSASLTTLRFVVAVSGNDGCVALDKKSESRTLLVVGRANGKGMVGGRGVVVAICKARKRGGVQVGQVLQTSPAASNNFPARTSTFTMCLLNWNANMRPGSSQILCLSTRRSVFCTAPYTIECHDFSLYNVRQSVLEDVARIILILDSDKRISILVIRLVQGGFFRRS